MINNINPSIFGLVTSATSIASGERYVEHSFGTHNKVNVFAVRMEKISLHRD